MQALDNPLGSFYSEGLYRSACQKPADEYGLIVSLCVPKEKPVCHPHSILRTSPTVRANQNERKKNNKLKKRGESKKINHDMRRGNYLQMPYTMKGLFKKYKCFL